MRVGYKYVAEARSSIDASAAEHVATMGYRPGRYETAEAFLAAHDQRWVHEFHEALTEVLDPDRLVLSIGSGEGEHEVLLHRDGYRVVASDVVPDALNDAARLFPGLQTMTLDVFDPVPVACDDVLATGLEFYFDDHQLAEVLQNVHEQVAPNGRFFLVLRYRDNLATKVIDRACLPLLARVQRARGIRVHRKAHGYRRSVSDVMRVATPAGFRLGRVRHAAFGMEIARLVPPPGPVIALDRRLHVLNSAMILELLPVARSGAPS